MKTAFLKPGNFFLLLSILFFAPCVLFSNPSITGKDACKPTIYQTINEGTVLSGNKSAPPLIVLNPVNPFQSRVAQLTWTTDMPLLQGVYNVERRLSASAGPWDLLATLPYSTFSYEDIINAPYCGLTNFVYRIRFVYNSGADTTTSLSQTAILSDKTSPANVHNLNVSIVNIAGGIFPRITWDPITNDSISGYIIQQVSNSGSPVLGTVPADSAAYTHKITDFCTYSYNYIVITKDKCGNVSAPDYDSAVQTIVLKTVQPGPCDRLINLTWNPNRNIPGGIGGFKIFRNDGTNSVVYDAPASATSYTDASNINTGQTYLYTLKEYNKSGTFSSYSCEAVQAYLVANKPEIYNAMISVDATDSYVRVFYHLTPSSNVYKMVLQRSENGISDFEPIDSLQSSGPSYIPTDEHIDDVTADFHNKSFYYRLVAYDDCGGITSSFNISRTLWLQSIAGPSQYTLNWNSYTTWIQDVESYKVYRYINGQIAQNELIATLDPGITTYTDVLTGVDPASSVCYYVVAIEKPGNPYLLYAVSRSNTACNFNDPQVFMPNAFHPDGDFNKVLRPVSDTAVVDHRSFKLTVFSRWGQQLFETTDMVHGWDGTSKGERVPAGVYIYLLTYKSSLGKEYTKRGTVVLVR